MCRQLRQAVVRWRRREPQAAALADSAGGGLHAGSAGLHWPHCQGREHSPEMPSLTIFGMVLLCLMADFHPGLHMSAAVAVISLAVNILHRGVETKLL